jgi:hypothetical protein
MTVFAQNPFNDELNLLKSNSNSIDLSKWDSAQLKRRPKVQAEDSISLTSSALKKKKVTRPEIEKSAQLSHSKIKKLRKRSR